MSTSASSEAHSSIDLSELLSFNVSFKNLEFVLRTVLSRLDNVEHTVADNHDICADRDRELSEALDDAKRQLEEQKDIQAALSERCNELARQVAAADAVAKQAQERADDAHRRIDALGAAKAPTTPPAAAPIVSPVVAAAAGKNYDDDIAALQRAVNHLTETKADKKIEDDVRAVEEGLRDAEEKLASLQEACEANDASSKQRDDDLGKRIDALSATVAAIPAAGSSAPQRSPSLVPTNTSNEWIAPLSKLTNTVDRIKADQDALSAKLAALAGLAPAAGDNNVDSGISPAQFALLQAAVNELEKRPLSKDYDQAIELLNQQVRALGNECSANAAEAQRLDDMKANKADLDALTKAVAAAAAAGSKKATSPVAASSAPPPSLLERSTTSSQNNDSWVKPVADTNRRIDDLQKQLGALEGLVRGIDIHRVERNVTGLGDDVDRLRAAVDELRKNGGSSTASTNDPNNRGVSKGGDLRE
ncbi:Hypothetical protein, putative [Bodo saltans]|uniref:Uncharacterized protein n=1 Tax=Bodo saltans TaxID=75058 RepID=A0A0S4II91_BODSA|nr:Hypothetical protein, putative [Bodo saltans]|eukprot:CUE71179.1 Hypothetical protein, putative [Bodo saltans]